MPGLLRQPVFPIMIERLIFEMAVEDIVLPPSRFAVNLQLTAKRVRLWIQPMLYRVFEYTHSPFPFPDFEAHPHVRLHDVGRFARHLAYDVKLDPDADATILNRLLRNCPNISNLGICYDVGMLVQLYPALQSLSGLRRLSAGFRGLTRNQVLSPVFLNLTHLNILGSINFDLICEFKNLTHLSITDRPRDVDVDMRVVLGSICHPDGCSSLRVIIMYQEPVNIYDTRLVVIRGYYDYLSDWMNGANGKMDVWAFAERIVAARERGYMYFIANTTVNFARFNFRVELTAEGQHWWQSML